MNELTKTSPPAVRAPIGVCRETASGSPRTQCCAPDRGSRSEDDCDDSLSSDRRGLIGSWNRAWTWSWAISKVAQTNHLGTRLTEVPGADRVSRQGVGWTRPSVRIPEHWIVFAAIACPPGGDELELVARGGILALPSAIPLSRTASRSLTRAAGSTSGSRPQFANAPRSAGLRSVPPTRSVRHLAFALDAAGQLAGLR
jgi:hypothetical protein